MNIADDWNVGDTTSPAEIEAIAATIAALPTSAERHAAIARQREIRPPNIADLIERSARRQYQQHRGTHGH